MRKEILKLAVPNILTNLTVPLVSLVDLSLMGRMNSSSFILAIGFGSLIFNFIYWLFGFLRMGTTGLVSQAYGAKRQTEILLLLIMGLSISLLAGILFVFFQYPIFQSALYLIQPDAAVVEPLSNYYYCRIYAAPATISVYVLSGWLLGMQEAKSALYIALIINVFNALLSVCFVYYSQLGIFGVALGTVIAQYFGLIFGLLLIRKKYKLNWSSISSSQLFHLEKWKSFIRVNSDLFLRTLCLIFAMSFFKTKAGNIDPVIGAANILLLEFVSLSAYGIDGFAFSAESVCGKYFGKQKLKQFIVAMRSSFRLGIVFSLLVSLVFWVFGKQILQLMTDQEHIIEAAMPYLIWLVIMPVIGSIAFIWDGIYIGTTSSKVMRNSMVISTFFVFLPLFFLLKYYLGNHGMWISFLAFLLARGIQLSIQAKKAIINRIGQ